MSPGCSLMQASKLTLLPLTSSLLKCLAPKLFPFWLTATNPTLLTSCQKSMVSSSQVEVSNSTSVTDGLPMLITSCNTQWNKTTKATFSQSGAHVSVSNFSASSPTTTSAHCQQSEARPQYWTQLISQLPIKEHCLPTCPTDSLPNWPLGTVLRILIIIMPFWETLTTLMWGWTVSGRWLERRRLRTTKSLWACGKQESTHFTECNSTLRRQFSSGKYTPTSPTTAWKWPRSSLTSS